MHHLNYFILLLIFPFIFTGLLILPAILTNKKRFFILVPVGEIILYLVFVARIFSNQFISLFEMYRYFFSGVRLIHIPVVIVPLLVISIIVANIGANFVHRVYSNFTNVKKRDLYHLYTKLDKISSQENSLTEVKSTVFNIIDESEIDGYPYFSALDDKLENLQIVNNHDMSNPFEQISEDETEENNSDLEYSEENDENTNENNDEDTEEETQQNPEVQPA